MFLNQLITLSVFFHSLTFSFSDKAVFIFCNICLLILSILFFEGFSNVLVGRFKKLTLCDETVTYCYFASLACITPSLFVFFAVFLFVFLHFDVIAFCKKVLVFFFTKAIHN